VHSPMRRNSLQHTLDRSSRAIHGLRKRAGQPCESEHMRNFCPYDCAR
jgi:hypothetical protein